MTMPKLWYICRPPLTVVVVGTLATYSALLSVHKFGLVNVVASIFTGLVGLIILWILGVLFFYWVVYRAEDYDYAEKMRNRANK